jgi:hypothetical protein
MSINDTDPILDEKIVACLGASAFENIHQEL